MGRSQLVLAAALAVAACDGTLVTDPGAPGRFLDAPPGVTFTAAISRSQLQLGDTASLHFVLRNGGLQTLRMSFSMGCPTLPYVAAESGETVYPSGGPWMCTAVISNIELEPGEQRVHTVPVHAFESPHVMTLSGAVLGAGRYAAYAELTNGKGRTNSVEFTISR